MSSASPVHRSDVPAAHRRRVVIGLAAAPLAMSLGDALAQGGADIVLPPAQTEGGMPLMQALKARRTSRSFAPQELTSQMLSDLLWAAFGINRPDGHRTAPSARNWQEIEVFAVLRSGAYRYDSAAHRLVAVAAGDLRPLTGMQPFVPISPLNLVFVADYAKMKEAPAESQALYAGTDTGFISQNIYLFAASAGLATVVRGSIEREPLAKALRLTADQKITLSQTVGYPEASSAGQP